MQTTTKDPRLEVTQEPRPTYLAPKDREQLESVMRLASSIHNIAEANAWALPRSRIKLLEMLETIGTAADLAGHKLVCLLSDT